MVVAIIKDGIVDNRIVVSSIEKSQSLFPDHISINDDDNNWNIGDTYTE